MSAWCWCLSEIYPICQLLNIKLHVVRIPVFDKPYFISPRLFPRLPYFIGQAHAIFNYAIYGGIMGFILSFPPAYLFYRWMMKKGEEQSRGKFIRGTKFDSSKRVAKLIKKSNEASDITIDGFPLVKDDETKHILVHGTTGTGKSQLIAKILDCIRKRGDRAIVYDKGGLYTSRYYRDGKDYLLNPFDSRSQNWCLWDEARTEPDFRNMTESLIPENNGHDPFWVNAPRSMFGSAAFTMQDAEDRSIKKLLDLLFTAKSEDLTQYLSETDAATFASDKSEKTAISIRSVLAANLKSLRYLSATEKNNKPPFCIRDWLANEKDQGWLFLTSTADQLATLRPLISMWFSMATISMLSLPENPERRIWFVCDELPTLNKQPQLFHAMAEARKYGGCFLLGMQSFGQIQQIYGKDLAKPMYDLVNTAFYFRSPSQETAQEVSKAIGEQEIEDMHESYSYGANSIRDGISINASRIKIPLIFVTDIKMLKDLHCYLKLAENYPVTMLNLKYESRKQIANHFMEEKLNINNKIEHEIDSNDNNKGFAIKKINTIKAGAEPTNPSEKVVEPEEQLKETKENNQEAKSDPKAINSSPSVNYAFTEIKAIEKKESATEGGIEHLKKELSEMEFKVLDALYSLTKKNLDKGIEMNRKALSKILNRAKENISRATTLLCQKGLIHIEAARRGDGRNVNIYKVNTDKVKNWKK